MSNNTNYQSVGFTGDDTVFYLDSLDDLRLRKPSKNGEVVVTSGETSIGDGSGAFYVWSDTATGDDNGETIIKSQYSTDTGRYLAISFSANADILRSALAASDGSKLVGFSDSNVYDTLTTLNNANANKPIKSVMDYGVIDDPNGNSIEANTTAYMNAFKECAGKFRLYHPKELSVVMKSFATGELDGVYWLFDGNWKLANGEQSNIFDITGWTNFVIEGIGCFDGNKANQTGATYPNALGGIVSNLTGTKDTSTATNSVGTVITIPPMPVSSTNPSNVVGGRIEGIEIKNCWNWPICLAYVQNVYVYKVELHDSNSSPQFFDNANNCWFIDSHVYNIDDGGFVFYRGNTKCGAYGNNVHDCNQGIGVYAEYDSLPVDSFITIQNNIIWNNRDGGTGITTGLTPPALNQQRIIVSDNIYFNNNTGGRNGGGSIGIVGAQGIMIKDNMIFGDGNGLSVTTPSYGIFVDSVSTFIDIDGNQIADIGCSTGQGVGIYLESPNNVNVSNNTGYSTQGKNGFMKALLGGGFGAACSMSNNRPLGDLAGSWDQIYKPADLMVNQRDSGNGSYAISNGITVTSGDIVVDTGYIATSTFYGATAQGNSQSTAQGFNQQVIVVTSAHAGAGIILPNTLFGATFTIHNRSGVDIMVYPPVNGQIEGLGENNGVTLKNTNSGQFIGISSGTFSGGEWYGNVMSSITG